MSPAGRARRAPAGSAPAAQRASGTQPVHTRGPVPQPGFQAPVPSVLRPATGLALVSRWAFRSLPCHGAGQGDVNGDGRGLARRPQAHEPRMLSRPRRQPASRPLPCTAAQRQTCTLHAGRRCPGRGGPPAAASRGRFARWLPRAPSSAQRRQCSACTQPGRLSGLPQPARGLASVARVLHARPRPAEAAGVNALLVAQQACGFQAPGGVQQVRSCARAAAASPQASGLCFRQDGAHQLLLRDAAGGLCRAVAVLRLQQVPVHARIVDGRCGAGAGSARRHAPSKCWRQPAQMWHRAHSNLGVARALGPARAAGSAGQAGCSRAACGARAALIAGTGLDPPSQVLTPEKPNARASSLRSCPGTAHLRPACRSRGRAGSQAAPDRAAWCGRQRSAG